LIQKSARKVGDWETLLVISLAAMICLFPFIYHDIHLIFLPPNIFVLLGVVVIFFTMSLLNFESLKEGKISVVEPIFTLEVPVAVFLAFILFREVVSRRQGALIALLVI